MITKREIPKQGTFLAIWTHPSSKYLNACQLEWRDGVLYGFNDFTEYWEVASEENGWYGVDEAYYLVKEDLK